MGNLRVGINGFGRIGRIAFRAGKDSVDYVGINDTSNLKTAAHLLEYDSTHGRAPFKVETSEDGLLVDGNKIPVFSTYKPEEIPWDKWEAEMVFECTGAFKKKQDFQKHIKGPVKKVLVSAPAEGADFTVVYGVNHKDYDPKKHHIVSNGSCTTNCLAPVAKVIHEKFGINKAMMTTIHSYTNDQRILDAGHSDLRRARSAALSMIPTTTGAAKAVGKVLPALAGKIDGMAIRVPTPDVSVVDFVALLDKDATKEDVNNVLIEASKNELKGVLHCEEKPLVSVDYIGNQFSSIVDLQSTMVMQGNLVKIIAWYDNEMGFSYRMIDIAKHMHEKGL